MKALVMFFAVLSYAGISSAQDTPSFSSSTFSLPVADLEMAEKWYKQVLGDVESFSPAPGVIELKLNDITWLQLFEGRAANSSVMRLEVKDITQHHSRLVKLGLTPTTIESVPNVVSYFDFSDPDGNQLSFYKLEMP